MAGIQAAVGATGLVGGILLAVRPDGSLLQAKVSALNGTPFADWRVPGTLLAIFVGGGLLGASVWVWRRWPADRVVAIASAVGLITFEVVQFLLIGFQALQAVMSAVGVALLWLSVGLVAPETGSKVPGGGMMGGGRSSHERRRPD